MNIRIFNYFDKENFSRAMQDVYQQTKCPFVIIIDEWDCIFREYRENHEAQEQYLDFLRDFLKDKAYIHLAYMTGILPIKKYGTHSALNMFDEFSMTNPGPWQNLSVLRKRKLPLYVSNMEEICLN